MSMKMEENELSYVSPQVEIVSVQVERGFEVSAGGEIPE